MNHLRAIPLLLLCGALLAVLGCTGELREARGAEVAVLEHPVDTVHAAAVAALEQEGIPLHTNRIDAASAKLEGEYADGDNVTVLIERLGERTCELTLRVGAFGDDTRHARILSAMESHF